MILIMKLVTGNPVAEELDRRVRDARETTFVIGTKERYSGRVLRVRGERRYSLIARAENLIFVVPSIFPEDMDLENGGFRIVRPVGSKFELPGTIQYEMCEKLLRGMRR